jgi:hypothetical protein
MLIALSAMEVATIVAGGFLLYHIPFPFLMAPICFALMYLTMDTAPAVYMRRHFTVVEFAYVAASQAMRHHSLAAQIQSNLLERHHAGCRPVS